MLANLIFLASSAFLSTDQFKAFGWRIPFLVSIVLVFIGIYVRLKISESPIFKLMKKAGEEIKIPLVALFRRAWKEIVIVALSTLFTNVMGFIGLIYMLGYATTRSVSRARQFSPLRSSPMLSRFRRPCILRISRIASVDARCICGP